MPLHILNSSLWFPPVEDALEDGLLAMGGDLCIERLLLAYQHGIFPWFDGNVPLWWCPDPRFVLFPTDLKVSKSMRQLLQRKAFDCTVNEAFREVIYSCKFADRKDQDGTWITNDVAEAYIALHEAGFAHSAEVWLDGELAGGLYGVRLGRVFFGESMFSRVSNASKYAFISYVDELMKDDVGLIDCQVYTTHLESLGAAMIERKKFLQLLKQLL